VRKGNAVFCPSSPWRTMQYELNGYLPAAIDAGVSMYRVKVFLAADGDVGFVHVAMLPSIFPGVALRPASAIARLAATATSLRLPCIRVSAPGEAGRLPTANAGAMIFVDDVARHRSGESSLFPVREFPGDRYRMKDCGVNVVDIILNVGTFRPKSSVAPYVMPPLIPPPASHMVKPCGLWSRPLCMFPPPEELGDGCSPKLRAAGR